MKYMASSVAAILGLPIAQGTIQDGLNGSEKLPSRSELIGLLQDCNTIIGMMIITAICFIRLSMVRLSMAKLPS